MRHLAVRADAIQPVDLDRVDAGTADELVADAVRGVEDVVAGPAVEAVAPAAADERVGAGAADEQVVAATAPHEVGAGAAADGVVAAAAVDAVRAAEAVDAVGVRRPAPGASPRAVPTFTAASAAAGSEDKQERAHDRGQGPATKRAHGDGSPRHATTIVRPPTAGCERNRCVSTTGG